MLIHEREEGTTRMRASHERTLIERTLKPIQIWMTRSTYSKKSNVSAFSDLSPLVAPNSQSQTRVPKLRPPFCLCLLQQPLTVLCFCARCTHGWFQKRGKQFPSQRKKPVSDVYPQLHDVGTVMCSRSRKGPSQSRPAQMYGALKRNMQ